MSKGGGTTTQKADPWGGLQPYLRDAYAQAQKLYQSGGPEFYPNATYVPFSEQSNLANQLQTNRALVGSQWDQPAGNLANALMMGNNPYYQQAGQTLGSTASGSMLNANPYLNQMFNQAAGGLTRNYNEAVLPGMNATFGSAGRTGSGAHALSLGRAAEGLGSSLGGLAADIYGGNYQAERDRQMNAAQGLSSLGQQDIQQRLMGAQLGLGMGQNEYNDIAKLAAAGQGIEGKAGEMLSDFQNRFNYYQQRPEQMLGQYVNWINGLPSGGGTTTTSSGGGSATGSAIGGALAGAALTPMANAGLSSLLSGMGVGGTMGTTVALAPWLLPVALGLGGLLNS